MASYELSVHFDGVAVESGTMDVKLLAPSLMALSELHQAAHSILHPDDPAITLNITATAPGSFEVALDLAMPLWDQVTSFFASNTGVALKNLAGTVGGLASFLVAMRKLRVSGRRERDDGTVEITFDDGSTFEVSSELRKIIESAECRAALRDFVAVLDGTGVDSVEMTGEGISLVEVRAEDVPAFELPEVPDTLVSEDTYEQALTLVSVAFAEGNKWRLSDGDTAFFASIEDPDFLRRVKANEIRFAQHDILRARVRGRQFTSSKGLRSEYAVEEVLEHIPAARQQRLPLFDDDRPDA